MSGKLAHWLMFLILATALTTTTLLMMLMVTEQGSNQNEHFDAVIIPGGGLDTVGQPLPWVQARLDAALRYDLNAGFFLVLSRGTTHKPPPLDHDGFAIDEASSSAQYLVDHGVQPSRIVLERWSLDTIGNAVFARLMHAELRGWKHCLVITSAIHMPRTAAIFDWIFALQPQRGKQIQLKYQAVPEQGITEEHRAARQKKEELSLQQLQESTMKNVRSLAELHQFIFQQHTAYSTPSHEHAEGPASSRADPSLMSTY
mmetsp:Transcript_2574/g.4393  ORF Transcript_2574/g.4393 Transcript_2574/m.4393 type:complete len:258 (+) Transcript_2574:192-965(+)